MTVKKIITVKMLGVLLVKCLPLLQINARNETSVRLENESILNDHLRNESKHDDLIRKTEVEVAKYLTNSEHISHRQDPLL